MKIVPGTIVTALLLGVACGQEFLIPAALYPVQGAPFTAVIQSEWTGGRGGRNRSREVRDTAGRQRLEMPMVEEAAAQGLAARVTIYDLPKKRMIVLNTLTRTARITPMAFVGRTVTMKPLAVSEQGPCSVIPSEQALGTKIIAGLETCGHHLVQTFQKNGGPRTEVRDLWLSRSYRMPLAATRDDARLGHLSQEVLEFDPSEPDPRLFDVPQGYTVEQP